MQVIKNKEQLSIIISDNNKFITDITNTMTDIGVIDNMAPNFKQKVFDNLLELKLLKLIGERYELEYNTPHYLKLKLNNEVYKYLIVNIKNDDIGNGLMISKTLQG